ncbi:zinc finger protein 622-like [Mizuhopecten yessoensis]|uniref:Zinc finger protein 622 n=1 Tax=Mizuhopecten yessoensis TaxID=6573 RepID=A0A210PRE5_MIZYE|nr:zinc finger protein 622-like [Mizuhopecten yessoensis]XP_021377116.1 zinc finger protein 622-like [Mizuhopecten yessoensis]OWF39060.1 Zinc finger protein 622 [Mizuhopecten yessoensis]
MSLYTCITCRVGFTEVELQRSHYKTDWHRYNLKRKVAELPPVTAETFQQKVLAQRAKVAEEQEDQFSQCALCSKHFNTKNAYENHLKSKKHKEAVAKQTVKLKDEVQKNNEKNTEKSIPSDLPESDKRLMKDCVNMARKTKLSQSSKMEASASKKSRPEEGMEVPDDEGSDAESCDSWDESTFVLEECLFCSHVNKSLEDNVKHMTSKHSFFIPDVEFLVDLEGLMTYLGEKVGCGHICMWCNNKGKNFHSTQAVQKHMLDKGHCKMLHEGNAVYEYTDFYDYRTSYPDHQEEEFDEDAEDAGIGLEDVEMQEDAKDEEEEVDQNVLASENYELVLPSGATIGHRSLQKYYRQNLPQRESSRTKALLPNMLAHYKALGWTGAKGAVAQKRVKDLAFMQRLKLRQHMRLGVKANKWQPHFRSQNP